MADAVATEDPRTAELAANLAVLTGRIRAACERAGRSPDEVTMIAVTKTFPADDVRRLAALGVREVAENRDQEARQKTAELADLDVRWHFVGQLQRNKVNHVAGYADVVHSVDRAELARALSIAAERHRDHPLAALLQVNLDPDPAADRGGAAPDAIPELADLVAGLPGLALTGLMAVAPLGVDPEPAFGRLARVAEQLRAVHPRATMLSAGMSADLEAAIPYGTTHVRVGTALLGGRARPVG
jgi:PLP dependent protein